MPATVETSYQGTAQAFQSLAVDATLPDHDRDLRVYVVLGILYESFHPSGDES